jgi:hypothetical protein
MLDIVSDTVGPSEAGAWLSLEDAARFLRVTVRTVDRRGLPMRRLPGHPTEVWVAGADDTVSDVTETSDGHNRHGDERAIALSERVSDVVGRQMVPLLAEFAASRQRIEDLARENGLLTAHLAAANERIAALKPHSRRWWPQDRRPIASSPSLLPPPVVAVVLLMPLLTPLGCSLSVVLATGRLVRTVLEPDDDVGDPSRRLGCQGRGLLDERRRWRLTRLKLLGQGDAGCPTFEPTGQHDQRQAKNSPHQPST